jgi:hypothetical protein
MLSGLVLENDPVGTEGFEPLSTSSQLANSLHQTPSPGAAKSGAVLADFAAPDPDLQELIRAWQTLPAKVRADIVSMVKAAGNHSCRLPSPAGLVR